MGLGMVTSFLKNLQSIHQRPSPNTTSSRVYEFPIFNFRMNVNEWHNLHKLTTKLPRKKIAKNYSRSLT